MKRLLPVAALLLMANPGSAEEVRHSGDLLFHGLPSGHRFLYRDYPIDFGLTTSDDLTLPPDGWVPALSDDMDNAIPRPWPETYVDLYDQPFAPATFFTNVVMICNHLARNPADTEAGRTLIDHLVSRLAEYSRVESDAAYVFYTFDFPRPNGMTLSGGWVSAIANGFALRGLAAASTCLDDEAYIEKAHAYANAFFRFDRDSSWIVATDPYGFLWLDEYPGDDGTPSFVLNGHIHAMLGLTAYGRLAPSEDVERLIQGAATTMRELGHLFRVEGEVNRYALRSWDYRDYLPPRTPRQQRELHQLTGDPYFLELSKAFAQDIAD